MVDPPFANFRSKHRTEPVLQITNCIVADIDAVLMLQVLNIQERQGKFDVQYERQVDDLKSGLELPEWRAFGHPVSHPARLKSIFADSVRNGGHPLFST